MALFMHCVGQVNTRLLMSFLFVLIALLPNLQVVVYILL